MTRHNRRWEEPDTSSSLGRRDDFRGREIHSSRSFNYWRDGPMVADTYRPRRSSYRWESRDEQWRDGNPSRQPSYPGQRLDFRPSRDWDDPQSNRERNIPHYRDSLRRHYSTWAPVPYVSRPTFRPRSPVEPLPKSALPPPPREASPSSNRAPKMVKPSASYLSLSRKPLQALHDPAEVRKLLILDLNGTLLIRSPRSRTASARQLRPVQPRPYMQSFRQYLFCPNTMAWLDTMVWSSAQPHSVDDMVDKVFGASKGELKAVWNRKRLGLSEAEYHQKTRTTKDLTKPWNLLVSALGPHSAASPRSETIHSALTTLLLDDSPHKAALQPYNHICIPEYDSARRQHDLRSFLASRASEDGKRSEKTKKEHRVKTGADIVDQVAPESSSQGALPELAETDPYDVMLLAIIGVLETVKLQSNVAGWIRMGGLWATRERPEGAGTPDADTLATSGTPVRTGNDASSTSDPALTSEQAHLQAKMWFDDSLVLAYWVAQGRKALIDLGLQVVHGVTG